MFPPSDPTTTTIPHPPPPPHNTSLRSKTTTTIITRARLTKNELNNPARKEHTSKRNNNNAMEYRSKERERKIACNRARVVDCIVERVMPGKTCGEHLTEACVIEFKDGSHNTVQTMSKNEFLTHNARLALSIGGYSVVVGESSQGCSKREPKVFMETGGVESTVVTALTKGPVQLRHPTFVVLKLEHVTGRDWKNMKSNGMVTIPRIDHIQIFSTAELDYLGPMKEEERGTFVGGGGGVGGMMGVTGDGGIQAIEDIQPLAGDKGQESGASGLGNSQQDDENSEETRKRIAELEAELLGGLAQKKKRAD